MTRQPWRRTASIQDRRDGYARALGRQKAPKHLADAQEKWRRGLVKPWRITEALDLRGMYGPEVDEACGAAEPDVDRWEAGELYPTWEQLLALADLTQFPVAYFVGDGVPLRAADTSLRFHVRVDDEPDPVLRYPPDVVARTVGA